MFPLSVLLVFNGDIYKEDNICEHYNTIFTSQNCAVLGLLFNSNMSGIIIPKEKILYPS